MTTNQKRYTSWLIKAETNGFANVLRFKCPNKPLTEEEVRALPKIKTFIAMAHNSEVVPG